MKVFGITAFCALALVSASQASVTRTGSIPSAAAAKDVLKRFLNSGEKVAMDAIVVQKPSCGSNLNCQFKMMQDASGRRLMIAVQPLSIQGLVSFDDGKDWTNYFPDERKVVVMPSPRNDRDDADYRIQLASQNYTFAMETGTRIAGRQATVVVVIPKNYGLATRKYSIDTANDVLLRIESVTRRNEPEILFDTKSVQYPNSDSKIRFAVGTDIRVRIVKPEMPSRLQGIAQAKDIVGFTPISLKSIPFGFALRESTALQSRTGSYVAQRLTDGIVSATLYQFENGRNPLGPSFDGLDFSVNNVTLRLVGDIPYEGKRIMMEQIGRTLGRTFRPYRELGTPQPLLPPKRMPEHEPEQEPFMDPILQKNFEALIEAWSKEIAAMGLKLQKEIGNKG